MVRPMLEQSERPEGPYSLENDQVEDGATFAQQLEENRKASRRHATGICLVFRCLRRRGILQF